MKKRKAKHTASRGVVPFNLLERMFALERACEELLDQFLPGDLLFVCRTCGFETPSQDHVESHGLQCHGHFEAFAPVPIKNADEDFEIENDEDDDMGAPHRLKKKGGKKR